MSMHVLKHGAARAPRAAKSHRRISCYVAVAFSKHNVHITSFRRLGYDSETSSPGNTERLAADLILSVSILRCKASSSLVRISAVTNSVPSSQAFKCALPGITMSTYHAEELTIFLEPPVS